MPQNQTYFCPSLRLTTASRLLSDAGCAVASDGGGWLTSGVRLWSEIGSSIEDRKMNTEGTVR